MALLPYLLRMYFCKKQCIIYLPAARSSSISKYTNEPQGTRSDYA